jgi:hypothetical protein
MSRQPEGTPSPIQSPSPTPDWFKHELKVSKDAEEWLKSVGPGLFKNYEEIQKLWNHPVTQFSLTLGQDAEFKAGIQKMALEQGGARFLGYEAVLLVILWVFRAWRLGKVNTWLTRIWTQIWVGGLYWLSALLLVPALVWGDSFRTVLVHLVRATLRHFFA